jgi:hypothetical protein
VVSPTALTVGAFIDTPKVPTSPATKEMAIPFFIDFEIRPNAIFMGLSSEISEFVCVSIAVSSADSRNTVTEIGVSLHRA